MKRCALLLLVVAVALPTAILAQSDVPGASVLMSASCSGSDVALSIDFTITQTPPAEFVGWVVTRTVLGQCLDDAVVTDVMPWPALGQTHLDLTVTPDVPYFDALYYVWGVDAAGTRTPVYWPQRTNWADADCLPGPTTVGHFEEPSPGYYQFVVCDGYCWPDLGGLDNTYPPEVDPFLTSGETVALYGELFNGMEGNYINATAVMPYNLPCGVVPTDRTTWSGLKADYR